MTSAVQSSHINGDAIITPAITMPAKKDELKPLEKTVDTVAAESLKPDSTLTGLPLTAQTQPTKETKPEEAKVEKNETEEKKATGLRKLLEETQTRITNAKKAVTTAIARRPRLEKTIHVAQRVATVSAKVALVATPILLAAGAIVYGYQNPDTVATALETSRNFIVTNGHNLLEAGRNVSSTIYTHLPWATM